MNRIRTRLLPVALAHVTLFAGAHSTSAQETRTTAAPLTLDEAIAIAIKNNRDIGAASHSVASANLAIATARSYRLPQFSVEALGAQSITRLGTGPRPRSCGAAVSSAPSRCRPSRRKDSCRRKC